MISTFLFLLCFRPIPLQEREDVAGAKARIEAIAQDMERLEAKLAEVRAGGRKLLGEVQTLEIERAMLTGQIEKHELELEEARRGLALNESREGELEADIALQEDRIANRLRELYKRGSLGYSQMLLKQSQLDELIGAYHYAKVLTRRDREALQTFSRNLEELDQVRANLVAVKEAAEEARAGLAKERKSLDKLLKARNAKLNEIRRESRKQKQLMEELDLEREELSLMIQRLTDSEADPMTLRVPISRYKGNLPWPLDGKVLRNFGVYRDPRFQTRRRQNGVSLFAEPGTQVKAVYSGKVIFADWFQSYGNMVIIDHGEKVISFYGHCRKLFVNKGDYVERDAVIAESGDTGSLEGPLLHFEIREKTKPVNPNNWLKRR